MVRLNQLKTDAQIYNFWIRDLQKYPTIAYYFLYDANGRYEMNNLLIYREFFKFMNRWRAMVILRRTGNDFPLMYPSTSILSKKLSHDPEVNNLNASAMVINSISTGML